VSCQQVLSQVAWTGSSPSSGRDAHRILTVTTPRGGRIDTHVAAWISRGVAFATMTSLLEW
jgi:hypothetical protein